MTMTLNLRPATLERLRERTVITGANVEDLVEKAVESYLNATSLTFDAFLAPLRKQVAQSGMTDAEVDQLLQESIDESRNAHKLSTP